MPPLEQTNIQTAFAVPIMLHQWDDCDALNQGLREAILEKEKRDTGGRSRSNIGGWHSQDDLDKWTGAAGKDLVQRIIGLVNHATSQIYTAAGETENDVRWSIGLWANVNRKGHYNNVHIHPYSTWSGVYYVDPGDQPMSNDTPAGTLTFLSPNLAGTNTFFTKVLPQSSSVRPSAGLMVLFPSYLQHFVHPYEGERPRISIAFNATKQPWP